MIRFLMFFKNPLYFIQIILCYNFRYLATLKKLFQSVLKNQLQWIYSIYTFIACIAKYWNGSILDDHEEVWIFDNFIWWIFEIFIFYSNWNLIILFWRYWTTSRLATNWTETINRTSSDGPSTVYGTSSSTSHEITQQTRLSASRRPRQRQRSRSRKRITQSLRKTSRPR